jgi:UDP-N-acetylglucosamine--N-acetylmuramyl-(pentapeptide) pyrophosphoryl-undecaprenol N-acetylglucosamine transferase
MPDLPHISHPRILFYAVNGLGLGHVTRLLAVARAVRTLKPGAQILFLTTSEGDSVIHREGFASVKIPSKSTVQSSGLRPSTYLKLAHTLTLNVVSSFNPALLVVDTFPAGAVQELLGTLTWEMKRAFVYRAQHQDRARDPFFQAALGHYDVGIVPHNEGDEEIIAPDSLPMVWTGPILIRDRDEALNRNDARRRLGLPVDGKLLYVTVGGGGDKEMAESEGMIFDAARSAGWTVAAPDAPLGTQLSDAIPDHRINYYPMAECMNAFDGAVSAAGYNSVAELLHMGVPTVLIPRTRGLDDQFARAEAAQKNGAALIAELKPDLISACLKELMDGSIREKLSKNGQLFIRSNGAAKAAEAILRLL